MKLANPTLLRNSCYIRGRWIATDDARIIKITNPATGQVFAEVPDLSREQTVEAIEAAHQAFPDWRDRTAEERAGLLHRWHDLIMANAADLARLMTAEQGKPLAEAAGEVSYGASFIRWYAEEARRVYGETIPARSGDQRILVIRQPVGVCALITPWNFPIAMITRKAGPALAAGCTLVARPASQTPLCALALAALAEEAGFPPGVFNVITGSSAVIGPELTGNPKVRKLSFTGSTEVGKKLLADCAGTVKRVSMELGGNAPLIVFDDADLDRAVEQTVACKFRNTGQTCVCANRIYVQAGVYQEFSEALARRVASLRVGPGTTDGVDQGPLINADAVSKVKDHIADATRLGAVILTGGEPHELGGNFFQPTVLGQCTQNMAVAVEETFGPVAPLFRFETEAEAIAMANDSEVGLSGYFFSRDMGRILRVAEALEVGMVGVNTGVISDAAVPFGGVKESGMGREGGRQGMAEYLEDKYILLSGIQENHSRS